MQATQGPKHSYNWTQAISRDKFANVRRRYSNQESSTLISTAAFTHCVVVWWRTRKRNCAHWQQR